MIQQPSGDQSNTAGHEEWRRSGAVVSCKTAHECHTGSHDASVCDTRQEAAETDYVLPNSNIRGFNHNTAERNQRCTM